MLSAMTGDLSPGTILGGYRIEGVIGRGGMGIVYRATQLALQRPVALKVIAPNLAEDEGFRRRFRRESMLAAAIDHPNIIPVYEAGEVDGVPFIAMRFVKGTDLGAMIIERGPLKTELVRQVVEQVGSALDAAHAAGLVHRDIKPANILVADDGGDPNQAHVYLTDFGLTKGRGESKLTQTGTWVGTVSYIAPEQVEGRAVDGRADLYSLACVVYESLTAHPPFERDSDIATLYAHLQDDRPRPSQLRPGMPPAVDAVVAKGMARNANDRYQSGSELGRALRDALLAPVASTQVGQPVPTFPPPAAPPTRVDPSTPPATPPISLPPTEIPAQAYAQAASTPPPAYTPPPPTYYPPEAPAGPGRGGGGRPPWLIPVAAVAAVVLVLLGLWAGGVFGGGGGEAATTTDTPPTTTADPNTLTTDTSADDRHVDRRDGHVPDRHRPDRHDAHRHGPHGHRADRHDAHRHGPDRHRAHDADRHDPARGARAVAPVPELGRPDGALPGGLAAAQLPAPRERRHRVLRVRQRRQRDVPQGSDVRPPGVRLERRLRVLRP